MMVWIGGIIILATVLNGRLYSSTVYLIIRTID